MLKCTINPAKKRVKVKGAGTLSELAADTIALISLVHQNILERNLAAADEFKRIIQASMLDPKSSVFKMGDIFDSLK